MSLKLHIGCGTVHLEGYINIDIRYLPGVDSVDNAKYLRKYAKDSVDEIYACHVLEHFSRWEYKNALRRWNEIIKPNGVLRIAVPDFEAVINHYNKFGDLDKIVGLLYGGQDYDENFHHYCWTFKTLKRDLMELGFQTVERYDWKKTEFANIDDFSKSYLPHMDRDNGMLMSLNVLATK